MGGRAYLCSIKTNPLKTKKEMSETGLRFDFAVPTRVLFGAGRLAELHAQPLPGRKALVVISNGRSTRANGYLARTESELDRAGVAHVVFDGVQANPLKSTVEAGARMARAEGCDFVVALGGGSVIDCVKAICLLAPNDGDLWDYVHSGTGRGLTAPNDPLPFIAITTTAGTGSEVDCAGVITNPETNEKVGVGDPRLFARLAIVDPELMTTVPPRFTAYQGFDALFHSTEGYVSRAANLYSDMLEERVISAVGQYLPRACRDGSDLEARTRMAFANTLSGYSMMTAACTAEHSIEHAMSAYHQQLPHGAGLIMISQAYYSAVAARHVCDKRLVRMARLLGKADASRPEDFVVALAALQEACGVADLKMSDYGITPDEFPTMATNALQAMGGLVAMDRKPFNHDEIVALLQAAYR